jgi:hypothetical protein
MEPDTTGRHQDRPYEAMTQMPCVACPDQLALATISALPEDHVHARVHLAQHRALGGRWQWRSGGAVAQREPLHSFQHDRSHCSVGFCGWSHEDMGDGHRLAQLHMQAKAGERLLIGIIIARVVLAAKADTPGSTNTAADGEKHALADAHQLIVADQHLAPQHPHAIPDRLHSGSVSPNGRTMDRQKRRKNRAE